MTRTLLLTVPMLLASAVANAETESAVLDIAATVPERCSVADLRIDLGTIGPGKAREVSARGRLEMSCAAPASLRMQVAESETLALENETISTRIPIAVALEGMDIVVTARINGDEPAGTYRKEIPVTLEW
jgi:hypothetical protein